MSRIYILFSFLVFYVGAKAQTETYTFKNFQGEYNIKEVYNALSNINLDQYRKVDERVLLHIINGPTVELFSAKELQELDIPVSIDAISKLEEVRRLEMEKTGNTSTSNHIEITRDGHLRSTVTLGSQKVMAPCLDAYTVTQNPSGTISATATGVRFCISITGWSQDNSNWIHGIIPSYGAGLTNFTVHTTPASQDGIGTWGFQTGGVTGSFSGNSFGPGWYYERNGNTDPGDNLGDNATGGWTACFTVDAVCNESSSTSGQVCFDVTTDSESGAWTTVDCAGDPNPCINYTVAQASMGTCVLPVSLLSFSGQVSERGNLLSWFTVSEDDNDYFTLEKSSDGVNFEPFSHVDGSGKTISLSSYEAWDLNPYYATYYRLKQADSKGVVRSVGNIVYLKRTDDGFSVQYVKPTVFRGNIQVGLISPEEQKVLISVYDNLGRTVYSREIFVFENLNEYDIDLGDNVSKGMYYLSIRTREKDYKYKLIKE